MHFFRKHAALGQITGGMKEDKTINLLAYFRGRSGKSCLGSENIPKDASVQVLRYNASVAHFSPASRLRQFPPKLNSFGYDVLIGKLFPLIEQIRKSLLGER